MSAAAKDHVYVGLNSGRREYVISPQLVQTYAETVREYHPWYTSTSPFGGPVAPALIRHSETYVDRRWYLPNLHGNLHAKQEWELFAPIMVGERITTHSVVIDRYIKRGRDYVVNEILLIGHDGRLCARSRTHQSFLLDLSVTGEVFGKEREKQAGRRFEVGQGVVLETLAPLEKTADQDMCVRFSGPGKNYHTDQEAARELGFPEVVVQGMLSVCFLSELMTKRFGEGWFRGGKMSVNLVNILWMNETVTTHGVVKEITPEGGSGLQRAHLEVWCQKTDGTVITVGNASATIAQQ
jgi:acyl dehydratase